MLAGCAALWLTLGLLLAMLDPLAAQSPYNAPGDTLTVIMAPLPNIPAIHIPGETLIITCLAPPATANWQAQLKHGNKSVALDVTSSQYLSA
ncbi:MAG TPA: hypothetical protein PKH19_01900, partial [Candidatus Syntrophosphaera sp.]|nr:hypothetical protein [Candidatus Syntrophosphaera sp.]